MKTTFVTAFGDFLEYDHNSTEEFLNEIPNRAGIIKKVIPVGYFKKEFTKPIKKFKHQRIIFLGMHEERKRPMFEVVALNQQITLKNHLYRFIGAIYSYYLKWHSKNIRINKSIPKERLTIIPIQKSKPKRINLHSKLPNLNYIDISNDAGNYVCNYSMWIVENYIKKHNLDVEFFFIHLPPKLKKEQKRELLKFILG